MSEGFILILLTFSPLFGALLVLTFHKNPHRSKLFTLGALSLNFLFSLILWFQFPVDQQAKSLSENMVLSATHSWLPTFGIKLALGVDGLNLLFILLTTFLAPIFFSIAWKEIKEHTSGFCFLFLLIQTGILGTLMATDLFSFYVFWEMMLIPMFFLLGVWGGRRRIGTSVRLLIANLLGSFLMLIAIGYLGFGMEGGSFDLLVLYQHGVESSAQHWLFVCFALAFLLKTPLFPFHIWQPEAYVEAPIAVTALLSAIVLKMGMFGFIRFAMPLFPGALLTFLQPLTILAILSVIYGALLAFVQTDMKRLIAYASVSQIGLAFLGLLVLNEQGLQGGMLQAINHGLSVGSFFFLLALLVARRGSSQLSDYGGLARIVPRMAFFFGLVALSLMSTPGLNGFVGDILILLGVFATNKMYAWIAGLGLVLSAVYILLMLNRLLLGPIRRSENRSIPDLDRRELSTIIALSLVIIWLGLAPQIVIDKTSPSVRLLIQHIRQHHLGKPTRPLVTHKDHQSQ